MIYKCQRNVVEFRVQPSRHSAEGGGDIKVLFIKVELGYQYRYIYIYIHNLLMTSTAFKEK